MSGPVGGTQEDIFGSEGLKILICDFVLCRNVKTPFFSKSSPSPFSSLSSSPDLPRPESSTVEHVEEANAVAGKTIAVDRSALFNPPDHSHEPAQDSELVKHLKSVIKVS
ncbi:hypothetical protein F2Q69_00039629 [Brassica cretica]|uniref:Uncharacterized protein n=1 Tax=Brassica cretica TaxID=69181 RepID=A0A8S9NCE8_BRACR|nr:hypothetical protein F2Q69_00039629 [Brassica cretica]